MLFFKLLALLGISFSFFNISLSVSFCLLGFGEKYEYHGVPVDGYSYRELKEKFDSINKKDVSYEKPEEPKENTIKYEQPSTRASKKDDSNLG